MEGLEQVESKLKSVPTWLWVILGVIVLYILGRLLGVFGGGGATLQGAPSVPGTQPQSSGTSGGGTGNTDQLSAFYAGLVGQGHAIDEIAASDAVQNDMFADIQETLRAIEEQLAAERNANHTGQPSATDTTPAVPIAPDAIGPIPIPSIGGGSGPISSGAVVAPSGGYTQPSGGGQSVSYPGSSPAPSSGGGWQTPDQSWADANVQ